ncbi:MAG: peptidoglycan DD-metalloendopeptidase family protein [Bacteroidia bacterium]
MYFSQLVKTVFKYVGSFGLALMLLSAFSPDNTLIAKRGPDKRDSCAEDKPKQISKEELVYMVDSILDLDTVSVNAIELLTRYSAELEKASIPAPETHLTATVRSANKFSMLPAGDIYEDFDVENLFSLATDACLPELANLTIASDSLGTYAAPICGIVTSNYGWRDKRMHKGIDIDLNKGDKVLSAFDGMVRIAKRGNGYGNVVIVRHYNGLETVYAHLSKIKVKAGQVVTAGTVVGLGGMTGHATGTHLHFEVRYKGHALNPANFISFESGQILNDTITIRKSKYGIAAFPSNAEVYTVQRGDSWFEIAKRYGLTTAQMKSLNGTDKRFYLKVGQKIRIN